MLLNRTEMFHKTNYKLEKFLNATFITVTTRIFSGLGGLAAVLAIVRYLDAHTQGYYYAFQSLIALQIFFDMGLSQVLLQVLSHEFEAAIPGNKNSLCSAGSRVQEVIRRSLRWYTLAGFGFFFFVGSGGLLYFASEDNLTMPWLTSCAAQGIYLALIPIFIIREASGSVREVSIWKFFGEIIAYTSLLVSLVFGLGLYSIGIFILARSVSPSFYFFKDRVFRKDIIRIFNTRLSTTLDWKKEVLPFQSRIAISWFSGYLIYSSITPILLKTVGPIEAGRFGMTWSILQGIVGVSMAIVSVRTQSFCAFLAKNDILPLKILFKKVSIQSTSLLISGLVVFIFLYKWTVSHNIEISYRIMSIQDLIVMSILMVINQITFTQALLIRARKIEPYLVISIVGGMAQLFITVGASSMWGLHEVVISMLLWSLFVGFPWSLKIYFENVPWNPKLMKNCYND
jgi:O-antigen/teichoic acid export membrane protein